MQNLDELKVLSARVGANPLLVQGPGGNTSLKVGDVMWIKASGTWLKDAETRDIFVALDLPRLTAALAADDPACESCLDFIRTELNPQALRPSIETSVHGLMPQAAVVHVHCVSTIAHAIRSDAREILEPKLAGFNWSFIPYARPGLELARAIRTHMKPGSGVLVLGNHGLAVAAATVAEAEALLVNVTAALAIEPRATPVPDLSALEKLAAGSLYRLPQDPACHAAALDPIALAQGTQHVYYPDHAVFLGTEIPQDLTGTTPAVAVPGCGVLIHRDAKPAIEPMLRCAGDVFRRVSDPQQLKALTQTEIAMLLNWDAEKYRQTLNQTTNP
jgi:rhamnose utilization protein RhaD (predicted bifunctional aldolase and dehydrogenase)